MIVILWCCFTWCGITLTLSKSKYKILYYLFYWQHFDFSNLKYHYFHADCSTFLKIKNVYKCLLQLWFNLVLGYVYMNHCSVLCSALACCMWQSWFGHILPANSLQWAVKHYQVILDILVYYPHCSYQMHYDQRRLCHLVVSSTAKSH